uniref:Uncharacterized protein n=1 Tax=Aegilops tauschii subsp. strangulata TaxID=200361 RepID=A0A453E185_AEGTS
YTGIKQPAAWRCRPGSGGRWTRSWSWARRSSRSTTPASSSSSDVATLLRSNTPIHRPSFYHFIVITIPRHP